MTRKLEQLFDLPDSQDDAQESRQDLPEHLPIMPETLQALDKIESALPTVRGLELADEELDELATLAKQSFNDLSDLGMQVDSRFAAEIFSVASNMLGHAITAKTAKLDKKLKMIELQMKKLKLDREGQEDGLGSMPTAQGHVLDRNELLRQILDKSPAGGSKDNKH
jgi:hypothetical protein